MSELAFLSPDLASGAVARSPLARALEHAPAEVVDLSLLGKLDVRGDVAQLDAADVVRLTPRRALVLCDPSEIAELRRRFHERFDLVVDVTAAYAGLQVTGEAVLRRLTDLDLDLDLDALPAVGSVAHVQGIVLRSGDDFRIFFPQEYGHHVAEVVLDALAGLA